MDQGLLKSFLDVILTGGKNLSGRKLGKRIDSSSSTQGGLVRMTGARRFVVP